MKTILLLLGLAWGGCSVAYALTRHVAPPESGITPQAPYTNWATAATSLHTAVAAAGAGDTILVSNGTYYLTNHVTIGNLTLRSWNNGALDRDGTILDGNNYPGKPVTNRCLVLSHVSALVEGVTVTNGFSIQNAWWAGGGGVLMSAGTLRNCLVTGNTAMPHPDWAFKVEQGGGGVYAYSTNSIVTNCDLVANVASNNGGGAYIFNGGQIWNSRILKNRSYNASFGGGGLKLEYALGLGASVHNSIIAGNTASSAGGGVYLRGDTYVRNCLVVSNTAPSGGGVLVYSVAGDTSHLSLENCTIVSNASGVYKQQTGTNTFRNSILYYNGTYNFADGTGGRYAFTNCCLTNAGVKGTGNITNAPQFAGFAAGDFRLAAGSPGVDAGLNQDWMAGAADVAGRPRLDRLVRIVDMGCYERVHGGTLLLLK